jgi:integrase
MSIFKKIEYSLKYNRTGKLNRNGKALIQIRAYQNAKSLYFSTEVWIEPEFWDEKNKRVKSSHPNGYVFNKRIRDKKEALEAFEAKMISFDGVFPVERLREFEIYNSDLPTFTSFYEKELSLSTIQPDSLKNQKTTLKKLSEFRRSVRFEDLDFRFIVSFDRFLRKQELGINTINKHHRNLGKYIRLGIKNGYLDVNADPYIKFSPDRAEPKRVFLELPELERTKKLVFQETDAHFQRIRDFFLVGCWTGLRFSDIKALRPENLVETGEGLEIQIQSKFYFTGFHAVM